MTDPFGVTKHQRAAGRPGVVRLRSQHPLGLFLNAQTRSTHDERIEPTPRPATPIRFKENFMLNARLHKPYQPIQDVPDDLEPGALPVEPDEGPVPALIPDDPGQDPVIDPQV